MYWLIRLPTRSLCFMLFRTFRKMLELLQRSWGTFLGALGFPAQRYICFRPYVLPVIVGLCLGITIHMMSVPFLEEGCDTSALRQTGSNTGNAVNSQITKSNEQSNGDKGNDDFEARIIQPLPSNLTVDKEAVKLKVARPRHISVELGIREKLFVAVFTSASSVDKLGLAIDRTMTKHVTKALFFSSEKPRAIPNDLPIVAFSDKQLENFPIHVLRYIKEHYPNTFDFYLLISDRTYLRAEKYFNLVEHISVKEDVYMGVPGQDRNFCSLEGGVLLSQSVMAQVLENLDRCTSNAHSDNPSITLGHCVHHSSQKFCTQKAGFQTLTYYQLVDFDYDADIKQLKLDIAFNSSLTFFPMPDDISHYKLHRYFCYVDLNDMKHEIEAAKQDIINLSEHSPGGRDSLTWPIGVPAPYKPVNRHSVIQWTYFTETHLYLADELTNMKEISGADKLDINDIKKTTMENLDKKYHSQFYLKKILNGYRRFDPTRGNEYILDLLLTDTLHHNAETIKRVHLVRPLGKVELVPMPYVTESMIVNLILPLKPGDGALFDIFMDSYSRTYLQNNEDVKLIVVLAYSSVQIGKPRVKDSFAHHKTLIMDYNKRYDTQGKLSWIAIENVTSDINIMDKIQDELKFDMLVLFTTVNMEINTDLTSHYFNRVRMNTIKGKQVFFPMGFWQYKPNLTYNQKPYPASVEIGQRLGQFDTKSFDHFSFYLSDYKTARKKLSPSSVQSGDIFNMFVASQSFHVFRAVEPNLKLRWMNWTCDPGLSSDKYQQCVLHNVEGLASQHHLALLIFEQQNNLISQGSSNKLASDVNERLKVSFTEPQNPPPLQQVNVKGQSVGV